MLLKTKEAKAQTSKAAADNKGVKLILEGNLLALNKQPTPTCEAFVDNFIIKFQEEVGETIKAKKVYDWLKSSVENAKFSKQYTMKTGYNIDFDTDIGRKVPETVYCPDQFLHYFSTLNIVRYKDINRYGQYALLVKTDENSIYKFWHSLNFPEKITTKDCNELKLLF